MTSHDIDELLAGLSQRDVDPGTAEAIRLRAHRVLSQRTGPAVRPQWPQAVRLTERYLEPLFALAVACLYVTWALAAVHAILVP